MIALLQGFLHAAARSVTLLTPIAWPIVALVAILIFRKQLARLLNRLKGAKGYGVEVVTLSVDETRGLAAEFANSVRDFMPSGNWAAGQPAKQNAPIHIGPKKSENFYFFSHDLMLCYTALLTGAEPDIIVHTLRSAIAHLEQIAPNTPYQKGLLRILKDAERTSDADWTEKRRAQEARKVWLISRSFGDVIQRICRDAADQRPNTPKLNQ